jgi:hypothetical protein
MYLPGCKYKPSSIDSSVVNFPVVETSFQSAVSSIFSASSWMDSFAISEISTLHSFQYKSIKDQKKRAIQIRTQKNE